MNDYLSGTPQDELTDEVEVNPSFRPAPEVTGQDAVAAPVTDPVADQEPAPPADAAPDAESDADFDRVFADADR